MGKIRRNSIPTPENKNTEHSCEHSVFQQIRKDFKYSPSEPKSYEILKLKFLVALCATLAEQSATAGIVGRRNMQCLIKLKKQKKERKGFEVYSSRCKSAYSLGATHYAILTDRHRGAIFATSLTSELADSSLLDYLRRRFAAS